MAGKSTCLTPPSLLFPYNYPRCWQIQYITSLETFTQTISHGGCQSAAECDALVTSIYGRALSVVQSPWAAFRNSPRASFVIAREFSLLPRNGAAPFFKDSSFLWENPPGSYPSYSGEKFSCTEKGFFVVAERFQAQVTDLCGKVLFYWSSIEWW